MAIDTSYMYTAGNTTTGTATTTSSTAKGKQDLDMNDFLTLMVEQMKNQDIGSTMDTSEYINQLSQYTMIQAVTEMAEKVSTGFANLQEMTLSTYSMSMMGKEATIAVDDGTGGLKNLTGTISGVTFYDGKPKVIMDGEQYDLSSVMSLGEVPTTNTAEQMLEAVKEVLKNDTQTETVPEVLEEEPTPATDESTSVTDAEILAGQSAAAQRIAEDSE